MSNYTSPTGNHWADAVHQRLDTGCYGPGSMSVNSQQLFVQLGDATRARSLATSIAGTGAIGERWEDADTYRTFLLALVGVPIVVTWTEPLATLPRGGRSTAFTSPRWKSGQTL